ncbi:hypothetical protein GJ744_008155 [Endocarpon pusillum]|uniref:Uncharacterized protein n=1 Tax=Endocarpon pusillum TaxID=364733 RepID=A0A8H7E723_9EURO|nr:hypothetical protein GJ744_008155 [Endocarpon pusillum]
MHTTRNPQLDDLAKADRLGPKGRKSLSKTVKLRYGIIHQSGEIDHAAFRTSDTIKFIGDNEESTPVKPVGVMAEWQ